MIEDEIPALIENVVPVINGNDTDDEDEFNEELMEFCQDPCQDLFSNEVFKTPAECLKHCKDNHGFDLRVTITTFAHMLTAFDSIEQNKSYLQSYIHIHLFPF